MKSALLKASTVLSSFLVACLLLSSSVRTESSELDAELTSRPEADALDSIEHPTHALEDSSELKSSESNVNEDRQSTDEVRLVCYYANWAVYRPGLAKFTPQNINPKLCTHVIYAFGGLSSKYEMKAFDPYNDINQGNYKKFTGLKSYNKNLKTMIAIGGWNEGSKRFSKLVADEELRKTFVESVVRFLRLHSFDGLDLDWEYPAFRDGSSSQDKEGYSKLIQELREAFEAESKSSGKARLLLTIAMPAGKDYIDQGFDVPNIAKNVDFMNLLTYDYYTAYDPETGHHSPLKPIEGVSESDDAKKLTVSWTVDYYISKGAPRSKLVVGIPTYGRSYTLSDPSSHDLRSVVEGPGEQGEATREKGYLAYYEICQRIKDQSWKQGDLNKETHGPYAHLEKQWVGYDDTVMVRKKAQYVRKEGLGGAMVWTLDNDDFRALCGSVQSPLITAIREELHKSTPSNAVVSAAESRPAGGLSRRPYHARTTTTQAPTTTTTTTTTTPAPTTAAEAEEAETTAADLEFTTPDPGVSFQCEDEGFFKNPKDCKKYFWCLDSGPANLGVVAHSFTCPSGLVFNPQTEACDYPANVPSCRAEKKPKKKKKNPKQSEKTTVSPASNTEAPTTTVAPTTTRSTRPIRRKQTTTTAAPTTTTTTTTTTTPSPPPSLPQAPSTQSPASNSITPELLAAALKLAREQEQPNYLRPAAGPSNDHLFQLLQLVKSLGGVDKVQELLNAYNLNKPSTGLVQPSARPNFVPYENAPLSNEYEPSRVTPARVPSQPSSNVFAPNYSNPRRLPETDARFEGDAYAHRHHLPDAHVHHHHHHAPQPVSSVNAENPVQPPASTRNNNRRRPAHATTPSEANLENTNSPDSSARSHSPFSFVYNEPNPRATSASSPVLTNGPDSNNVVSSVQPQAPRTRNRLSRPLPPELNNPVPTTSGVAHLDNGNVDGFFLNYNQPARTTPEVNSLRTNSQPVGRQASSRTNPQSNASRTEIVEPTENVQPSRNGNNRRRRPARVRIQTGFVVADTPPSPGVTYDEEAEILVSTNRNIQPASGSSAPRPRVRLPPTDHSSSSLSHVHAHQPEVPSASLPRAPASIEAENNQPTIVSRRPSSVRRRPPQRPHLLTVDQPAQPPPSSGRPASTSNFNLAGSPFSTYSLPDNSVTTANPFSLYQPARNQFSPSTAGLPIPVENIDHQPEPESDSSPPSDFFYSTPVTEQPEENTEPTEQTTPTTTIRFSPTAPSSDYSVPVRESTASNSVTPSSTTSFVPTSTPEEHVERIPIRRQRPRRPQPLSEPKPPQRPSSIVLETPNERPLERTRTTSVPARSNPTTVSVRSTPAPTLATPSASTRANGNGVDAIEWDQASGKVTCNRRGVHPHPQGCGQFVVCAPSKNQIKAYAHFCPAQQVFVKEVGRCRPGNRDSCTAF